MRTELTANMFNRKSSRADALLADQRPQNNNNSSRHLSSMYSVKENMLPPFLTAPSNSHQRRVAQVVGEGIVENVKETSTKNTEKLPGIFGAKGHSGYGFVKNAGESSDGQKMKIPNASLWTSGAAMSKSELAIKPQQPFVTQKDFFLNSPKTNNQSTNTLLNVFGFPPENMEETIARFTNIGPATELERIAVDWFRIRYENPANANEALKLNTCFIRNGYILGVTPVEDVPVHIRNITPNPQQSY
ncbi:hypothetical protein F4703DRAFT_1838830 [Phycomyces blakesleeanus]